MAEQKTGQIDHSEEMHGVYSDENITTMLSDCKWFNVDYILEVAANEPTPKYSLEQGFEDERLAQFLRTDVSGGDFGLYQELESFVTKGMVGPQGHPYRIGSIPFADKPFLDIVPS